MTQNIIQKKRSSLQIGDIVKFKDCCCKIVSQESRTNEGIGYGDTWNVNICKEINKNMTIKKDGKTTEILIGFAEMGNEEYDVII